MGIDLKGVPPEKLRRLVKAMEKLDPVKNFKPTPTQQKFLESKTYNKLLTAGGRAGKTTTALIELAMLARNIHPFKKPLPFPIKIIVFSISRQQAAMVTQRKLFEASEICGPDGLPTLSGNHPMIPAHEIEELNAIKQGFRTVYECRMKNGNIIYFAWSDSPQTWKRIQGVKAQYIYIDEAAGNKKLLIEMRKRVSDSQKPENDWAGIITWGATGTEINDAFEDFRNRCLDPKELDYELFHLKPGENPSYSKEAMERLASTMTEEEQRVHISGDSTVASLVQIYVKQWDDARHMRHVDYTPGPTDNLWVTYDPGVDHPTGMAIAAITREEPITLNFVKFWNHKGQSIKYDVECLVRWLRGRKIAGFTYDAAASTKEKGSGESVIWQLQKEMLDRQIAPLAGFYKPKKSHWVGISSTRHYLDPDPNDKTKQPYIRLNCSEESGCQLARYQMVKYRGKEETQFTGEGGVVKKEDEFPDICRYLVMTRPAYNPAWACGSGDGTVDQPPVPAFRDGAILVAAGSTDPIENPTFQKRLQLSRMRTQRSVWRVSDV